MKQRLSLFVTVALGFIASVLFGPPSFRARTCDVAFTYRMGAGFPGDVNRTHPFSVLAGLINTGTQVPRSYGDPCVIDTATNSYRGFVAGDQHNSNTIVVDGVLVRPYPTQQSTGGMSSALGAGAPPTSGVADFLRSGYVMGKIPSGQAVTKKGAVYVWCVATSGAHIQGQFEGAYSAGNTRLVSNAYFTGPADANGNVEIEVWAA
jgi:hypothetical protein